MSFVYSLILYNPLEALMSILFCDALTRRKFNVNDWRAVYVLSTVNLLIQYLNMYISNTLFKLTYNIFVNLVVMTITLFIVYFVFFYKEIDHKTNTLALMYRNAFLSQAFNFTSICIVIAVYNYIFEHVYTYACSTLYYEFILNMIVRIIQFVVVILIKRGVNYYEKSVKENRC